MHRATKLAAIAATSFLVMPQGAVAASPTLRPIAIKPVNLQQIELSRFPSVMAPDAPAQPKKRAGGATNWKVISPKVIEASQGAITAQLIANAIKKKLDGKSVGYSVTVMVSSGGKGAANGGFARSAPDSGQRAWKPTDRITVASVSKTFSAAAMMRVMASKGISLDAKISNYLPSNFTYGPNFKDITFREIMNHTSGIRGGNGCNISFGGLKTCAANGIVPANKVYEYQNENHALIRYLLPRIYGNNPTTAEEYVKDYEVIVNRMVMNSAGIPYATCKAGTGNVALSYESTTDNGKDGAPENGAAVNFNWASVKNGIDWGDMGLTCGSQGWNLSSDDLAKMAHSLAFTDNILPQATVDTMRDNNLGMFYSDFGGGLDGYGHTGWHPAGWNDGEINTGPLPLTKVCPSGWSSIRGTRVPICGTSRLQ
jgi:CubicO group peptidase (beta-lactamase class C family)